MQIVLAYQKIKRKVGKMRTLPKPISVLKEASDCRCKVPIRFLILSNSTPLGNTAAAIYSGMQYDNTGWWELLMSKSRRQQMLKRPCFKCVPEGSTPTKKPLTPMDRTYEWSTPWHSSKTGTRHTGRFLQKIHSKFWPGDVSRKAFYFKQFGQNF